MASMTGEASKLENDTKNSDWMSKLPESLLCEPLKNIAIPGEHVIVNVVST